ncbi:MAG: winged helix-turn-helix transcriptional regulator [Flavobacteriales bacterium]|nr:winged helix-turn-helix transcriptional regulator [Flavobacteriales bacterium]
MTKSEEHCIRVCPNLNQINACIGMLEESSDSIRNLATIHSMLGNEVRLKILYIIYKEQQVCVCDISDILQMTAPAISQHLKKLKDTGILLSKKVGQTVFYTINMEYMEPLLPTFIQITKNKLQKV